MSSVIGEQSQIVVYSGRGNQSIEIAYGVSVGLQSSPFHREYAAYRIIYT